jgi:hypothetical protein
MKTKLRAMTRHYQMRDNMSIPGRWHLGNPIDSHGKEIDVWQFSKGKQLPIQGGIRFQLEAAGHPLDFSLDTLAIPIVHQRVRALFGKLALQDEVQFIPVEVEGQREPWFVLNALHIIPCIDEARCDEVQRWLPEDGRPDKVGQYRSVIGLRVDPAKVGDARICRPWGWTVALIVSEGLKQTMEKEGITGTKFIEA